jgi:hypothetical protein
MGVSRYSPEGLPPEDFPLDMRYRINALYKLALSSFHAGNYEDTLKFTLKALEKNPNNLEILALLDRVRKRVPDADMSSFQKYILKRDQMMSEEGDGGEQNVDKVVVKQPSGGAGTTESDDRVKVLSPKVMKPRLVKGGNVSDSIQELAQKAKYNPPPEVSDLFDFEDGEDTIEVKSAGGGEVNEDETSRERHTRRTASVIEKLRAGRGGGQNKSELHKQIKMQLDQFKSEGFLVSRVEQLLADRNLDAKQVLDELIVLSSQIEMLKELKKRADTLEATPGVNKAKLMTLKLRLSDPDRVSEIIQEIEQMEAAVKGLVDV